MTGAGLSGAEPTSYADRVKDELDHFGQVENVHDLPAIYNYWSEGHLRPLLKELGFPSLDSFFLDPLVARCGRGPTVRVVSLGSGNGELELGLAGSLRAAGFDNFSIRRLELNEAMRERAASQAEAVGLGPFLIDEEADLNFWEPSEEHDVVIANHSLHHVCELERLFGVVHRSLALDGVFIVNDMIGRNGHMRWPEALDLLQRIWAEMPDRYRFNHQLKRHEERYENWDCSTEGFEGVRAEDILPLLNSCFHPEVFLAFANVIDVFIDRGFGHNFDPEHGEDREFIESVARFDEAALALGLVKPTHLIAHYRRERVECRFIPPLSPSFSVRDPAAPAWRPEAAAGAPSSSSPATDAQMPSPAPVEGDGLPGASPTGRRASLRSSVRGVTLRGLAHRARGKLPARLPPDLWRRGDVDTASAAPLEATPAVADDLHAASTATASTRSGATAWTCNICGSPSDVPLAAIERETASCPTCGSTLRWRAVVAALSIGLFGRSLTLDAFPHAPELKGLGMSDWEGYAAPLTERLGYRNTYLHQEPALNIMEPVPPGLAGTCDFVISSDVLEHVDPPWQRALEHFGELLVPGGLLVLTVPSKLEGLTEEHYPDLYDYKVVDLAHGRVLVNRTRAGSLQVFEDLVFHGGDGSTLELRLFSAADLLTTLRELGFSAEVWADPVPEHGVVWHDPWSTPIVARAPGGNA